MVHFLVNPQGFLRDSSWAMTYYTTTSSCTTSNTSALHLLGTRAPRPEAIKRCQVYAMKYLICEFRDTLLALVVALCSGVSVPLAPASRTVRLRLYLYI